MPYRASPDDLDLSRPVPQAPERELTVVLSNDEFIEHALADPTFPHPDGFKSSTKPLLDKDQQRILAVWIVEGMTRGQMQKAADSLKWAVNLSPSMIAYYRYKRLDLMIWASEFVTTAYARGGLMERTMRLRAVAEHVEHLKAFIDDDRLLEAETHTIGFGKDARNVTTQKFNQTLSKQYLEGLSLLDRMAAPIEERLERARAKAGMSAVPQDAQDRFIEAAGQNFNPYGALKAGKPVIEVDDMPLLEGRKG